jgi:hypothetical protein
VSDTALSQEGTYYAKAVYDTRYPESMTFAFQRAEHLVGKMIVERLGDGRPYSIQLTQIHRPVTEERILYTTQRELVLLVRFVAVREIQDNLVLTTFEEMPARRLAFSALEEIQHRIKGKTRRVMRALAGGWKRITHVG